jgi:SMC interacting uncharacterized protein involved in chromosome segregation
MCPERYSKCITQECDALQRDRYNLVNPEGTVVMILEAVPTIEDACSILTKERNTLRSVHKKFKIKYDELKGECTALKDNINAITEERDSVQRDRYTLVNPEGEVKIMLEKLSSTQEPHLIMTQERDTLRSEHEKLEVNFKDIIREFSALNKNLNAITVQYTAAKRS